MKINLNTPNVILTFIFLLLLSNINLTAQHKNTNHDFKLELEAEQNYYYQKAQFKKQESYFPSIAAKPSYSFTWNKGNEGIYTTVFARIDKDNKRSHFDIREFYYLIVKGNFELSIGVKKIYWGVTESNHLVDIINQTDQLESFDGEKKLGQPMVHFSNNTKFGTFDFFYLPFFRKRDFPGQKGRLRFPQIINKNSINFESKAKEWHQDIAIRWSHSTGIFDFGASYFYGTGREPLFNFTPTGINAFYPIINQSGIDIQITHNAFLWKLEGIYRSSKTQHFYALAAGLEYTFGNIKNSGIDISLLSEYLYDDRDDLALNNLNNDLFFGSRLAFNDIKSTEILLGGIVDLEKESLLFSLEASRRLGNTFKLEIEGRLFSKIADDEFILPNFKNDSFIGLTLFYYPF